MDTLFDEPDAFDRDGLARRVAALARENIFLGGSSWKYEGWIGQIYQRGRYLARGRFSRKLFEQRSLEEYAEIFPTVCGDFAFYQFPTPEFWAKLFSQVAGDFQFAFKVPEQITCSVFPGHPRYGPQAGLANPLFLDAELLRQEFLDPLAIHASKTGLLIFEFGAFSPKAFANPEEFLRQLDSFLRKLPKRFRYSVEIRNPEFLVPDYFACLRSHGVAHVYNAWTRMPELREQMLIPESLTAPFTVVRALLRQGRAYEDAVKIFSPYSEVRDVNLPVRASLREIIHISREQKRTAFIFINNRLEGNAPGTMVSILDDD